MFEVGVPTFPVRRPDGRVVDVSVPVDWPRVIDADGVRHRFVAAGHRTSDHAPAGLYLDDLGRRLWFCEGQGYRDD